MREKKREKESNKEICILFLSNVKHVLDNNALPLTFKFLNRNSIILQKNLNKAKDENKNKTLNNSNLEKNLFIISCKFKPIRV